MALYWITNCKYA